MPQRGRDVQMIVRVRVTADVSNRDALSAVRFCLTEGVKLDPLVSVAPIPSDRVIKKRRAPTKRERALLLEIMEGKMP